MRVRSILLIPDYFIALSTFAIAFCGIVYELALSQLLTVLFGSTVLRYSITIGLFLFSLGVGALLYERWSHRERKMLFFTVEMSLAVAGLVSPFAILLMTVFFGEWWPQLAVVLAYVPVIVIGALVGIEIPLLTSLGGGSFARVLSIDYFGSLCGTVVYALWMYPALGLMLTILVVAALNALVGIACMFRYSLLSVTGRISLVVICVSLGIFGYTNGPFLHLYAQDLYLERSILDDNHRFRIPVTDVDILQQFTTPYQQVTLYRAHFENPKYNPDDTCLNLDEHVQMCDSWYEAYHRGLVDVPLAMFSSTKKLNILLIGGGDFIPARFLREFDDRVAHIDMVDLDPTLRAYAETNPYLLEKNQRAFEYPKLRVVSDDALHYLRAQKQIGSGKYDLILVDLPGIKRDKLLPVYSVEFYDLLREQLREGGVAVSWQYRADSYPTHMKTLESTLRAAGFTRKLDYVSYNVFPNGPVQETESYFAVQKGGSDAHVNLSSSPYMRRFADTYKLLRWREIPETNTQPNSIFLPNYDIIVSEPEQS